MHFELFTPEIYSSTKATKEFFRKHKLTPELMEQCYTYIASMTNFKYTETGLIDGTTYIADNFPKDIWHNGFHKMLLISYKSEIFPGITQTDPKYLPYCALVPYILAAHKLHNNIPYEAWDKNTLGNILPGTLRQLVGLTIDPIFGSNLLLSIRSILLEDKDPETTYYSNYQGILEYDMYNNSLFCEFINLPTLAQIILMQTWCAHPSNRNNLMILDINDWDNMPEPLEIPDPASSIIPIGTDFNPWGGMFELSTLKSKPLRGNNPTEVILDLPWDT